METGFKNSSLNLETLREFCKREGEVVKYNKGDQMEREGDPTRWFAFVEYGCFKYLTYGISDDKEHVVWFSFKDEFVGDYPACLSGLPAQITIKATMPSRVIRVTSEQLNQFFDQNIETMELRSLIAEHMTNQFRLHYQNLYCASHATRALRTSATALSRHRTGYCNAGYRFVPQYHACLPRQTA